MSISESEYFIALSGFLLISTTNPVGQHSLQTIISHKNTQYSAFHYDTHIGRHKIQQYKYKLDKLSLSARSVEINV